MLITNSDAQREFPEWKSYCRITEQDSAPEDIFTRMREQAETELAIYVDVAGHDLSAEEPVSLPPNLRFYLMAIVRKNCFCLRNGDRDFEYRPEILRSYDAAMQALTALRGGEVVTPRAATGGPTMGVYNPGRLFSHAEGPQGDW